jgi:hypothetical protein
MPVGRECLLLFRKPTSGGRKEPRKMKRPLEIASGIGVLLTALLSPAAIFKMFSVYQQSTQKVPLLSIISLSVNGLAVFLSFVGAFLLLSWANKSK